MQSGRISVPQEFSSFDIPFRFYDKNSLIVCGQKIIIRLSGFGFRCPYKQDCFDFRRIIFFVKKLWQSPPKVCDGVKEDGRGCA
jgi:hypothetical protein